MRLKTLLSTAAAVLLASTLAWAANTTFLTSNGDVTWPISAPTTNPAGPGAIDNMVIGATTPQTGTFSGLKTTGVDGGVTCATYYFTGTPAATTQSFFVAPRAFKVASVSEVHSAAAGGTSTLGVFKDTSTNAPGAGTDVLSADFNLNGTANTTQAGALAASAATLAMAAGDRLSVKFANAIQSSAGVTVTACLAPQ